MSVNELPLKEWIVIFYPTTGVVRLCPSLDFAHNQAGSPATIAKHVYRNPADFRARHDHATLEKAWVEVYKFVNWRFPKTAIGKLEDFDITPPDVDTETFCKLLWEFAQAVGDRLSTPRLGADKTKQNYQLKLGDMRVLMENEKLFKEKFNNQARIVFTALFDNDEELLTEDRIKKIIYRLVADRQLKTKQEPWIIFQYYRPEFIKSGYMIRGRQPKNAA